MIDSTLYEFLVLQMIKHVNKHDCTTQMEAILNEWHA